MSTGGLALAEHAGSRVFRDMACLRSGGPRCEGFANGGHLAGGGPPPRRVHVPVFFRNMYGSEATGLMPRVGHGQLGFVSALWRIQCEIIKFDNGIRDSRNGY